MEYVLTFVIGITASLVAGSIVWFFRDKVRETLLSLDMSSGAVLGWAMAFIILGVLIAFAFMEIEIPMLINVIFGMLITILLIQTVYKKAKK